ncbi:MAG: hypothetical protein IMY80_01930 [Chloroflexi bacterium]|nr:hypothetical protein [Chloroflexota bacterium]
MATVNEELARFLCSKRQFSIENKRVKHGAFLPHKGATSVFMVVGLAISEMWDIGQAHVVEASGRTLHGCALIMMEHVRECGLELDPDNVPPRHASIVGWPSSKGEQKLRAMDLAARATLRLPFPLLASES